MAGAPLSGGAGDKDALEVGRLRGPLLDDYYGSEIQKRDVMAIAEEIKRRHLAKLPSETGNLRSTAQVRARRSPGHRDRRWDAEYSIGGPRADYIVPLEDEHHYLDATLREMGFYTGDIVSGPTGKIAARDRAPQPAERQQASGTADDYNRQAEIVDRIQQPRRRPGSAAMERDVAELRDTMAQIESRGGDTSLGRNALASYEVLRQAREER